MIASGIGTLDTSFGADIKASKSGLSSSITSSVIVASLACTAGASDKGSGAAAGVPESKLVAIIPVIVGGSAGDGVPGITMLGITFHTFPT